MGRLGIVLLQNTTDCVPCLQNKDSKYMYLSQLYESDIIWERQRNELVNKAVRGSQTDN